MEFSVRDIRKTPKLLGSQAGQGIVEYILVLVVSVLIILGGVYQLNSAFKAWAQAYFGDYLACLLETGELPNISGTPGDSGICQQLFKPFTLTEGRPLLTKSTPSGGAGSGAGGTSANGRAGGRTGPGGGSASGGTSYSDGRFRVGAFSSKTAAGAGGRRGGSDSDYTGSTGASSYEGGYTTNNRQVASKSRSHIDNRFAFDNESEDKQKKGSFAATKVAPADQSNENRIHVNVKRVLKDKGTVDDSPMTFGNFLRFLLIAAIIIALLVLVGGQMLQVGKSME